MGCVLTFLTLLCHDSRADPGGLDAFNSSFAPNEEVVLLFRRMPNWLKNSVPASKRLLLKMVRFIISVIFFQSFPLN